jgi:hypothetical protein
MKIKKQVVLGASTEYAFKAITMLVEKDRHSVLAIGQNAGEVAG